MTSPKDYLTERLETFRKQFKEGSYGKPVRKMILEKDTIMNSRYATIQDIEAFLTETIQQSMEVGREEERNRITDIIEDYTTPSHPHIHSMRWLKLDSETLNEMMKVINSVNK